MAVRKGAALRWLENRYLQRYLRGTGIEIGALWRRFPVPRGARVWYVDRSDGAGLNQHYPELTGSAVRPNLLADAALLPVRPGGLDFLIASHVLEHLRFPLQALRSWYEALAPGGALLLKVPDKRYTFDIRRPRTSLTHLIEEHENPDRFDDRSHYADWLQFVGEGQGPEAPAFQDAVQDLVSQDYSIHFHVWIDEDIREIIEFTRGTWGFDWKPAMFWRARVYRKEITALLRRS